MRKLTYLVFCMSLLMACSKEEGPGGTSSIQGTIMSADHEYARPEITEVFFTNGLEVEHGEYWILNNPVGYDQYYVFYDNPTWISEADPGLSGRTGIRVSFDYSDSNEEIAQATYDSLMQVASVDFSMELNVDVIRITNLNAGSCTDADEVTTPFEFNVIQDGRNATLESEVPAVDEKVFLIYGDNQVHSETSRTGGQGGYQFTNLRKGNYTLYVMSKDTTAGTGLIQLSETVTISENKEEVEVPSISILD